MSYPKYIKNSRLSKKKKKKKKEPKYCFVFWVFFFWFFFRVSPKAYGDSQTKGLIGATAAGLHHSHSNARSKSHLQPIPQLTAMLDP